ARGVAYPEWLFGPAGWGVGRDGPAEPAFPAAPPARFGGLGPPYRRVAGRPRVGPARKLGRHIPFHYRPGPDGLGGPGLPARNRVVGHSATRRVHRLYAL